MFTAKKQQLFAVPGRKTTSGNSFTTKGMENSAVVRSGNGSKKFSTTGNDFVDQFGKITNYRSPRRPSQHSRVSVSSKLEIS